MESYGCSVPCNCLEPGAHLGVREVGVPVAGDARGPVLEALCPHLPGSPRRRREGDAMYLTSLVMLLLWQAKLAGLSTNNA